MPQLRDHSSVDQAVRKPGSDEGRARINGHSTSYIVRTTQLYSVESQFTALTVLEPGTLGPIF